MLLLTSRPGSYWNEIFTPALKILFQFSGNNLEHFYNVYIIN